LSPELLPWVVLIAVVGGMLALDLLVFHRDSHVVSILEAATWSVVWIALGLGFGGLVVAWKGPQAGGEYLAGYLIEKSLSMDNVFLFAMLFGFFAVPARYQHRVLFWGVLGAIAFRAVFIAAGSALLESFHGLIYAFGLLLLITGVRMWRAKGHAVHPERNVVLRLLRRVIPVADDYDGQRLLTRRTGRLMATPLLAVLVVVETTDILFAVDSIPAIFAITTDPFLVFSSNAFAILGLRSLYFLLAGLIDRFVYLKQGLAALLVFAGTKILVADVWKMPIWLSMAVIVGILSIAVVASIVAARRVRGPMVGGGPAVEGSAVGGTPDAVTPGVPR
jgi:tellurite resistance protein TerC